MSASAVLTNPSVQRVRAALERAGMPAGIVELPGAARTAKAAAEFLGACRVDVAKLARLLDEPIAKADAEFVRRQTGFAIGGVAPGGQGVSTEFVEKALAAREAELAA
ncbi:MAG: hypothetical protein ACJ8G5_12875 [Burkholderiales bacterium]